MKPSKSMSMRSMRSLHKMSLSSHRSILYELQIDFVKELKEACDNFECYGIEVNRKNVNDEFYKNLKAQQKPISAKRLSMAPTPVAAATAAAAAAAANAAAATSEVKAPLRDSMETVSSLTPPPLESIVAVVDAYYDAQNELVEVVISKVRNFPRKLIQCIALLARHFRFLVKISIVKSKINGYTIHELQKLLRNSAITDVCLDGTSLSESNYGMLLSERTKLRHLSLSRCQINDDEVGIIASTLHYKGPASKSLLALNLSCNCITDAGAKHLALALRSNRCLRYLNLASNRITDDGALALLDTLREFPLLYDDIFNKRKRRFNYLKKKRAIYLKYFEDGDTRDGDDTTSRKSVSSRKSKISGISPKKGKKETAGDVDLATKVELLSLEILGLYNDPYGPEQVKIRDGVTYCLGNIVLCYLNLGYNSLSYLSIARLQAVLLYQSTIKKPADYGLLRALIDGNPLPIYCSEFDVIGQALTNSVFRQMGAGERRRASVPFKRTVH